MDFNSIAVQLIKILDLKITISKAASVPCRELLYNLLYPDYKKETLFNRETDIFYYINNYDQPVPRKDRINATIAELFNCKEIHEIESTSASALYYSDRPAIRYFCFDINMSKFVAHITELISQADNQTPGKASEVHNFIVRIMHNDNELRKKLSSFSERDGEMLAWIIIYHLFRINFADTKLALYIDYELEIEQLKIYNEYCRELENRKTEQDCTELNNPNQPVINAEEFEQAYNELAITIHTRNVNARIFKYIFTVASIFLIIGTVFLLLLRQEHSISTTLYNGMTCLILVLSLSILFLSYIPFSYIKRTETLNLYYQNWYKNTQIYTTYKNENIDFTALKVLPDSEKSTIHIAREKRRYTLKWTLGIMIAISLVISVIYCSFPLLICGVCISLIFYTFADYFSNLTFYAQQYDSYTLKEAQLPERMRGLAKLYWWEYEKNHLKIQKNEINDMYSAFYGSNCLKMIFKAAYDRMTNNVLLITASLIILNFIMLAACVVTCYIPQTIPFFRIPDDTVFTIFSLTFLIIIMIINIIMLWNMSPYYKTISEIAYLSKNTHYNDTQTLRVFEQNVTMGRMSALDIVRGIYQHNMQEFENGLLIEDLPEAERMHFVHREISNRPRLTIAVWLTFACLFSLIVWHLGIYNLAGILIILAVIVHMALYHLVLPKLLRNRLILSILEL